MLTLFEQALGQRELREFAEAQFRALLEASKTISQLQDENAQLKETLLKQQGVAPVTTTSATLLASTEQQICEIQIQKLRDTALIRDLTLEETKRLDLLVKNLYLAKGQPTTVVGESKRLPDLSEAELMIVATSTEPPQES